MADFPNGAPATTLPVDAWRKSARSVSNADCVEAGALPGRAVAVRNSRDATGPALVFTRQEMVAFLEGVKDGEFDHLVA